MLVTCRTIDGPRASFLVAGLIAGLLATLPAAAGTTAFTINFSGSASLFKDPTTVDFQGNATGNVTPFGAASLTVFAAKVRHTGGLFNGSMTCTFGNGDSIQAQFSVPGQDPINATATISGGTGAFANATGSINFLYTGVPISTTGIAFTLTGSGSVTTAGPAGLVTLSIGPPSLIFSFVQGNTPPSSQPVIINNGTTQPASFSVAASGGAWLSVSPANGTAQPLATYSVIATVNATGLGAGTYNGTVTITASTGPQFVVPVTMTVSSTPQGLVLSQTGLLFQLAAGASAPPGQAIVVINAGAGSIDWSTAVTAAGSWLSVAPAVGTSSATSSGIATVRVDPTGLTPGDYYGSVTFTTTGAVPQATIVHLSVVPASTPPAPSVLPTGMVFTGQQNSANPASQTVTVANPSTQPISVTAAYLFLQGVNWFTTDLPSATVTSSQPAQFNVSVNLAGLLPGVYTGVVQFTFADGSTQEVAITLVVQPSSPPAAKAEFIRSVATGCNPTRLLPVSTKLGARFNVTSAWPAPLEVLVVDDCGSPISSGSVAASFSSGNPTLVLNSLGGGRWSGTWQPRSTTSEQVVVTVLAQSSQPAASGTVQISGAVAANQTAPTVGAGGVVSAASYAPAVPLAPGALVSIFGLRLATALNAAKSLPLSTELGGTQVTLAGRLMPLLFTSAGQINAMVPYDVPTNTTQQLIVQQNGAYSMPEVVTVGAAQPGVFSKDTTGKGAGIIVVVKPDGTQFVADATHSATAGDAVVIYCAGLGTVNPPVTTGSATPLSPLSKTTNTVTATIGGKPAKVFFAGLTPGFAGLYQVNAIVPTGITPAANAPVVLTVAGQSSTPVTIPIQ